MNKLETMACLSTLYTQPHRHYHNMNHINDCLAEFEAARDSFPELSDRDRNQIITAIWFHDAVYNPYSKQNEANSADLIPVVAGDYISTHYELRDMIMATSRHLVTQPDLPLRTQILLDIDLSGFGQPFDICWKNSENIRKEYYNTSDLDFNKGRLAFLQTIILRPSLYYTNYFKEKYDIQSHKNLLTEIEKTKEILDTLQA